MNPSPDIGSSAPEPSISSPPGDHDTAPANWREALMALIAARFELIQLESKDAAREGARRAVLLIAACGCALFTWALLLLGGISLISQATGWNWDLIAMGAAGLHLLAGIILAFSAKSSDAESFPVTRSEFKKDRAWIENFQKAKKSHD